MTDSGKSHARWPSKVLAELILIQILAAMLLMLRGRGRDEWAVSVACFALSSSQVSLIAIWCVLGSLKFWKRILIALISVLAIWGTLAFGTFHSANASDGTDGLAATLVLASYLAVAIAIIVLRRTGMSVGREIRTTAKGRAQFTLADLLVLPALVAVASVAVAALRRSLPDPEIIRVFGLFAVGLAVTSILCTWGALARAHAVWRIAVLPVNVLAAMPTYFIEADGEWGYPLALTAQSAITGASLLVVRACGYRLTWA